MIWDAPPNTEVNAVSNYEIQIDGGAWLPTGSAEESYFIQGIEPGDAHDIRLRAISPQGRGDESLPVRLVVPGPPSKVTGLDPSSGDTEIELLWDVPADGGSEITGYEVQVDGGSWTPTGSTNPRYVVGGLTNGTSYFFRVRAVTDYGKGEPSDGHAIQPVSGPSITALTVPSQVSTWTIEALASGARIVVTAPSDGGSEILGYEVQVEGGEWSEGGVGTEFIVWGLSPGIEISVKIRAINRIGPGAESASKNVTPLAAFTSNPQGLRISSSKARPSPLSTLLASIQSPGVRFTWGIPWDGGSMIIRYEIQVGSGDWETVSGPGRRHDETATTGWIVGRVRAVNGQGPAIESNLAGAKLPSGPEFP